MSGLTLVVRRIVALLILASLSYMTREEKAFFISSVLIYIAFPILGLLLAGRTSISSALRSTLGLASGLTTFSGTLNQLYLDIVEIATIPAIYVIAAYGFSNTKEKVELFVGFAIWVAAAILAYSYIGSQIIAGIVAGLVPYTITSGLVYMPGAILLAAGYFILGHRQRA